MHQETIQRNIPACPPVNALGRVWGASHPPCVFALPAKGTLGALLNLTAGSEGLFFSPPPPSCFIALAAAAKLGTPASLQGALGVTGVEGSFRTACQVVLASLRRGAEAASLMMDAILRDNLVEWAPDRPDAAANEVGISARDRLHMDKLCCPPFLLYSKTIYYGYKFWPSAKALAISKHPLGDVAKRSCKAFCREQHWGDRWHEKQRVLILQAMELGVRLNLLCSRLDEIEPALLATATSTSGDVSDQGSLYKAFLDAFQPAVGTARVAHSAGLEADQAQVGLRRKRRLELRQTRKGSTHARTRRDSLPSQAGEKLLLFFQDQWLQSRAEMVHCRPASRRPRKGCARNGSGLELPLPRGGKLQRTCSRHGRRRSALWRPCRRAGTAFPLWPASCGSLRWRIWSRRWSTGCRSRAVRRWVRLGSQMLGWQQSAS